MQARKQKFVVPVSKPEGKPMITIRILTAVAQIVLDNTNTDMWYRNHALQNGLRPKLLPIPPEQGGYNPGAGLRR